MKRSSSLRLIDRPSQGACCSSTAISASSGCWVAGALAGGAVAGGLAARLHLLGRPLHGLDDVLIAGAATDVARQRPPDLRLRGVGVLLEQRLRDEHHRRRAEAALEPVLLLEALLEGVQLAAHA